MRLGMTRLLLYSVSGLAVVVGVGWTAVKAADFERYFNDSQHSFADNLASFLGALDAALWLTVVASLVCVALRLSPQRARPRVHREPDFPLTNIDRFVESERLLHRIVRWASGIGLLVVFILLGAMMRVAENVVYGTVRSREDLLAVSLIMLMLGIPFAVLSLRTLMTGLSRFAPRAETLLRFNRRRPVLYLRSFATDRAAGAWEASSRLGGGLLGWLPETYERSLAKAVASFGPLVAIGEPGESLPPFGAARLYVRHDQEWQSVVADLVRGSQLIILRIGQTNGFWWEFEHLLAHCDPKKVLIYLPREDHGQSYGYLRDRALSQRLCVFPKSAGRALFVGFGADWKPRLLGTRGWSWAATCRRLLTGSPAPAVREALNGAMKRLGLTANPLPFQFREWIMLSLLALFLLWSAAVAP